jgi:hypothetical protein
MSLYGYNLVYYVVEPSLTCQSVVRIVTSRVSNPHDYVEHVFKRPQEWLEFKI